MQRPRPPWEASAWRSPYGWTLGQRSGIIRQRCGVWAVCVPGLDTGRFALKTCSIIVTTLLC